MLAGVWDYVGSSRRFAAWSVSAFLIAGVGTARAATIQVGDACSVAQALEAAESDAIVAGCASGSGSDEIVVPAGTEEVWVVPAISLTSTVTLRADGGRATIRRDTSAAYFGLFTLGGSASLTLLDLTLRDGVSDGLAGCVDVGGAASFTARRVLFDGCGTSPTTTASLPAGSIHSAGTTLLDSCLVLNTLVNSADPGAIRVVGGVTTVLNTTITGSTGSGIRQWNGVLELTHATLAGNSGLDLRVRGGRVANARNTAVHRIEGSLTLSEGNVVDRDPMLAALGDSGGPTATLSPLQGSPLLDAADDAACEPLDQRGTARPSGDHCDVGAFEHVVVCGDGFLHPSEDCDGEQFHVESASCPAGFDGGPVCGATCQLADPPDGCLPSTSAGGAGGQPGDQSAAGAGPGPDSGGAPSGETSGGSAGEPASGEEAAGGEKVAGGAAGASADKEYGVRRPSKGDCGCRLPLNERPGAWTSLLTLSGLALLRRSRKLRRDA